MVRRDHERRSDFVCMKADWEKLDDAKIEVRQVKTGEPLIIPCHRELRAALAAAKPKQGSCILQTARGRPYTAIALAAAFRRTLKKIGIKGYSIHGIRKNAAERARSGKSWLSSATEPRRRSPNTPTRPIGSAAQRCRRKMGKHRQSGKP
jgi:integrase